MEATFGIVEIMGHRSHAGFVSEIEVFGSVMMQIVTPELPEVAETSRPATKQSGNWDDDEECYQTEDVPGHYVRPGKPVVASRTLLYGGAAIFSFVPCTEEEATAYERNKQPRQYERWMPDALALPAAPADDDELDADRMANEGGAVCN